MLFGHQDNTNQPSVAAPVDTPDPNAGVNLLAVDSATGSSLPVVPPDSPGPVDTPDEQQSVLDQGPAPVVDNSPVPNPVVSAAMPDPSTPFSPDPAPAPDPVPSPVVEPDVTAPTAFGDPGSDASSIDATTPSFSSDSIVTAADPLLENHVPYTTVPDAPAAYSSSAAASLNDEKPDADALFSLKQQVVTQLSPLVEHLEQSPEERFKTTMMLIQSTDNSALLQNAYNLAQAIPDERARAQALLDVVNEINYFTQQQSSNQ